MENKESLINVRIPEIAFLIQGRFAFVKDVLLRKNIAIVAQYIAFLHSLEESHCFAGMVKYSIFRDIIIHSGAIIEGLLLYKIKELLKAERIAIHQIFKKKDEYKHIKDILVYEDGKRVCAVFKTTCYPDPESDLITFQVLNSVAKKCGILDRKLFDKVENVKDMRNKIHLSGLKDDKDFFVENDVKFVFETIAEVLDQIERF